MNRDRDVMKERIGKCSFFQWTSNLFISHRCSSKKSTGLYQNVKRTSSACKNHWLFSLVMQICRVLVVIAVVGTCISSLGNTVVMKKAVYKILTLISGRIDPCPRLSSLLVWRTISRRRLRLTLLVNANPHAVHED